MLGKNLMTLGGKTLIQWAIESALGAQTIDAVMVTSDDPAICAEADKYCRWVLRRRPELATDEMGMVPVLQDAVQAKALTECGEFRYDLVVCLQPTSPFRTGEDIDACVNLLRESAIADSASSLVVAPYPASKLTLLAPGGHMEFVNPHEARRDTRRQDYETYMPNGAVYVTRRRVLMDEGAIIGRIHRAHVMPWERSVNVNSIWDFRVAEMIYEHAYLRRRPA